MTTKQAVTIGSDEFKKLANIFCIFDQGYSEEVENKHSDNRFISKAKFEALEESLEPGSIQDLNFCACVDNAYTTKGVEADSQEFYDLALCSYQMKLDEA